MWLLIYIAQNEFAETDYRNVQQDWKSLGFSGKLIIKMFIAFMVLVLIRRLLIWKIVLSSILTHLDVPLLQGGLTNNSGI